MLRKRESEMQRVEGTCVGVRERGWRPRVRGIGMADSYMDWLVFIVRGLKVKGKKKGRGGKGERENKSACFQCNDIKLDLLRLTNKSDFCKVF